MSSDNSKTRTRILQAALKLLEASQGQGVRMADIAKQAGVSRQAVYLHFSTRAELLIATTLYLDEVKGSDARLAASRSVWGQAVAVKLLIRGPVSAHAREWFRLSAARGWRIARS